MPIGMDEMQAMVVINRNEVTTAKELPRQAWILQELGIEDPDADVVLVPAALVRMEKHRRQGNNQPTRHSVVAELPLFDGDIKYQIDKTFSAWMSGTYCYYFECV